MGEKFYQLIISEPYTNEILEILNFHNLENAIAEGKNLIKEWYEVQRNYSCSLDECYEIWEEIHDFEGIYGIIESEFKD